MEELRVDKERIKMLEAKVRREEKTNKMYHEQLVNLEQTNRKSKVPVKVVKDKELENLSLIASVTLILIPL